MGFVKEFREFALKGNVLDMAVGVIIGAAFGGIVKSMIEDMIMPVVGIFGKADFSNLYIPLRADVREAAEAAAAANRSFTLADARGVGPVLAYGSFITIAINFVILAFCIFLVVKAFNIARKRFEAQQPPPPPAGPSEEVLLLREIRDSLKVS
jgi:large conductance mechanosensitive channel